MAKEAEQRRQQAMMEEEKGQGREGNGDEESKGGKKVGVCVLIVSMYLAGRGKERWTCM